MYKAKERRTHGLSYHTDAGVNSCQGEHLWKWIRKISELAAEKIRWEDRTDAVISKHTKTFTISVNGTDFCVWEPEHPTKPIDRKYALHKFKSAGLRYKIAVSVQTGLCV